MFAVLGIHVRSTQNVCSRYLEHMFAVLGTENGTWCKENNQWIQKNKKDDGKLLSEEDAEGHEGG